MSTQSLAEKSALITGSTSGIGLGIATALAAQGANVMLNGLGSEQEIDAALAQVRAAPGARAEFSSADVRNPDDIAELVTRTVDSFGGIDILVNNAGIQHVAPVQEFPTEKWDDILAINLSSAFHTIRNAVPHMLSAGGGRIVNVASAHATVASPFKSAYVAAKHGIAGLTKTVALELAESGITVNAVSPGYVLTPLVENQVTATASARGISESAVVQDVMLAAQPTRKFITIEQVADLVLFLCSESSASITGSILPIDGGWTAQ